MNLQSSLIVSYLNWKKDQIKYGPEMFTCLQKVVRSILRKKGHLPIYYRTEDKEDLIQDLVYFAYTLLFKIDDPTNKRIFNFLRVSIEGKLKDKQKSLCKKLDRDSDEEIERIYTPDLNFSVQFEDKEANIVATMLSEGYKKNAICKQRNYSRTKLNKIINYIKENYENL